MDCAVCNVRSSITYCNECQTLLCEECGAICDECRKRMCPIHTHETKHGRTLCLNCFTAYTEHRRRREAETEGIDLGLDTQFAEPRARLKHSSESLRPWVASLYMALAGAAGILLLLLLPSLRVIDLGAGKGIPTAYIVLLLPMLAVAWSALGLFTRWTTDHKGLNFIGLSIAAATIALTFLAVRPQAADFNLNLGEVEAGKETQRANETPEQLQGWRKDMLDRYEGENAPKPDQGKTIALDEVVAPPR